MVGHEKLVMKSSYRLLALLMQHAARNIPAHVRLEFARKENCACTARRMLQQLRAC
jgi:hypothetical protein